MILVSIRLLRGGGGGGSFFFFFFFGGGGGGGGSSSFLSLLWWGGGKIQLTPRGILSEARLFGLCPLRDEVAMRVVRGLTQAHC